MGQPSSIEIVWTGLSMVLLFLSMWQVEVALGDWDNKRRQRREKPSPDNKAAARLALYLLWTIILDTVVLTLWTIAGALSIFRHFLVSVASHSESLLALLLYTALFAFAGRVIIRAYTRLVINKM